MSFTTNDFKMKSPLHQRTSKIKGLYIKNQRTLKIKGLYIKNQKTLHQRTSKINVL